MLFGLGLLGGCARAKATVMAFCSPKEETAEEAQRRYEQAKAGYDQEMSDYKFEQSMNASWRQGYGFNNPNAERIRKGQEPLDLYKERSPPNPPRPPASVSGLPSTIDGLDGSAPFANAR